MVTGEPGDAAKRAAFWRIALLIALAVFINTNAGMFSSLKSSYLLKNVLHLSASDVATFGIIVGIPSYLRVFMGMGSDLFPLFGFHRRSYYALSWLLAAGSNLALAFLHTHYTYVAVLCVSLVGATGGNLLMVIMDAVMVEVGNLTGTVGRLQTIQQGVPMVVGATYLGFVSGYVTQHWSYYLCFLVSGLVVLIGLPLTLLIDEKRIAPRAGALETAEEREARLTERRENHARTVAALKQAASSGHLWAIVGFVFYLIFTPGTNTAQFYYLNDGLHLRPEQIGRLQMPGSIGAILGVLLFAAISRRIQVRAVVWTAYLMDCCIYLINMGMRNYLTTVIAIVVASFIGMIYNLALLTLAARATPKGIEGTVYGLVMAAIYLAGALGEKVGSAFYTSLGWSHSTTFAWYGLQWFGFAFTVIAVIFIPFLPTWARSREPLGSTVQHSPE